MICNKTKYKVNNNGHTEQARLEVCVLRQNLSRESQYQEKFVGESFRARGAFCMFSIYRDTCLLNRVLCHCLLIYT